MKSLFGSYIWFKNYIHLLITWCNTWKSFSNSGRTYKVDDECQAWVFTYLQQFTGNMKNDEILRCVTGTSVMLPDGISVCFNESSGLMRRPIVHIYALVYLNCHQCM